MILRKYLCFACAVLFIQSGYAKEQKPINLGETPWRFSKVVRQEMIWQKMPVFSVVRRQYL